MKKIQFLMLGIITALGALFLELLVFTFFNLKIDSSYVYSLNFAIIFSVFLEESVKIIILFQILKKIIRQAAGQKQIFLSAMMAGLGFSVMEIFLNLLNPQTNRYFSLLDGLGILVVHTGTFVFLGYVLAKKIDLNFSQFIFLFPIIFLFHLLYNYIIICQGTFGFYFLFLFLSCLMLLIFFWDLNRQSDKKNLPKSEIRL